MARIVAAPDTLPRLLCRRRVARARQRGKRRCVFAHAHTHAERACGKFHPLAQAKGASAEVGQTAGLGAGLVEARGRRVVTGALTAGQCERRPDRRCRRGDGRGPGPREEKIGVDGGGLVPKQSVTRATRGSVHWDFGLEAMTDLGVISSRGVGDLVEPDHGHIEIEMDARVEGVDDGVRVVGPVLEARLAALGDERVGFNSINSVIVACNDELSHMDSVGKPYFVLDQEPVGVVLLV